MDDGDIKYRIYGRARKHHELPYLYNIQVYKKVGFIKRRYKWVDYREYWSNQVTYFNTEEKARWYLADVIKAEKNSKLPDKIIEV